MTTITQTPSVEINPLAKSTGLAILIAITLNSILYTIGVVGGWLPAAATSGDVTLAPILILSIVPPLLGAVVFFALTRLMQRSRANRIFVGLSSLVLIAMSIGPVTNIIDPRVGTVLILEIMHLVVALPVMYLITRKTG